MNKDIIEALPLACCHCDAAMSDQGARDYTVCSLLLLTGSFSIGVIDVRETICAALLLETKGQRTFAFHQIARKTGYSLGFSLGETGDDFWTENGLKPLAQYRR